MIKRIHVNQFVIRRNKREGRNDPPITIRTSHGVHRTRSVKIMGLSYVIYEPNKPLSCGARLWIETKDDVILKSGKVIR